MYASVDIARQLELPLGYMAHCLGHMVLWDVFVPTYLDTWQSSFVVLCVKCGHLCGHMVNN